MNATGRLYSEDGGFIGYFTPVSYEIKRHHYPIQVIGRSTPQEEILEGSTITLCLKGLEDDLARYDMRRFNNLRAILDFEDGHMVLEHLYFVSAEHFEDGRATYVLQGVIGTPNGMQRAINRVKKCSQYGRK